MLWTALPLSTQLTGGNKGGFHLGEALPKVKTSAVALGSDLAALQRWPKHALWDSSLLGSI